VVQEGEQEGKAALIGPSVLRFTPVASIWDVADGGKEFSWHARDNSRCYLGTPFRATGHYAAQKQRPFPTRSSHSCRRETLPLHWARTRSWMCTRGLSKHIMQARVHPDQGVMSEKAEGWLFPQRHPLETRMARPQPSIPESL